MLFCVSGGWDYNSRFSDVLRYNAAMDKWEKTGDLDIPRHSHGASVVKWDVIAPLCTTTTTTTSSSSVGGTIMSKNYPSNNHYNYDEEWTLEAPEGHIIQLSFKSLDIELNSDIEVCSNCACDWVQLQVSHGSSLDKFCGPYDSDSDSVYYNGIGENLGSSIPGPFTSTGPTMTVRMHTERGSRTGFKAVWTSYPDPAKCAAIEAAAAAAAAVETINCISQAVVPSCSTCVCSLLCYWSPTGDLCTSCQDEPNQATLFLHHQQCPQGWVFSSASSTCFKAFNQQKPWSFAKSFCENGGGLLAQPKTSSSIQAVLDAINLQGEGGVYWLGGQWVGDNIIMSQNYPGLYPKNYDQVIVNSFRNLFIQTLVSGMAA